MMSISFSTTGRVEELPIPWDTVEPGDGLTKLQLTQPDGRELDVSAEVDRIVSLVPPGTYLRITVETVDA